MLTAPDAACVTQDGVHLTNQHSGSKNWVLGAGYWSYCANPSACVTAPSATV